MIKNTVPKIRFFVYFYKKIFPYFMSKCFMGLFGRFSYYLAEKSSLLLTFSFRLTRFPSYFLSFSSSLSPFLSLMFSLFFSLSLSISLFAYLCLILANLYFAQSSRQQTRFLDVQNLLIPAFFSGFLKEDL